jgi:putative colanic acid biosynthesis acetyltransferase WcaF
MEKVKTDLSTFSNVTYSPGKNRWIRGMWYMTNVIMFKSYLFPFYGLKRAVLRLFGARVGSRVVIKPGVNIKYPWKLFMGHDIWIGEGVWIDNLSDVHIGSHSCLSQGSMLLCGNHNYKRSSFDLITHPIELKEGVWIGAGSMVTQGVCCGEHSVLSVRSVASHHLEPYGIYRGNPAIKMKERTIER